MEAPRAGPAPAPGGAAAVRAEALGLIERQLRRPVGEQMSFADLDLDSIATMELIAELEDHFRVVLPFDSPGGLRTVGDALRRLEEAVRVAAGSAAP